MQKANRLLAKRRNVVFFLTALLIVVADQLSKAWIRSYTEEQMIFEAGFFRIIHSQNTGAAFGLFQGQNLPLTIIGLVGVAVLLLYAVLLYRRFPFLHNWLAWVGLGLVLGGTVGNLIDRLRLGYVTDFIDFGFWPAFNLADSAIVVGIVMFAYSLLSLARAGKL
jgi:signal peptidase II